MNLLKLFILSFAWINTALAGEIWPAESRALAAAENARSCFLEITNPFARTLGDGLRLTATG